MRNWWFFISDILVKRHEHLWFTLIKNKKKKRLVSGFFSVKNINFENIGVGCLHKKEKEKLLNLHRTLVAKGELFHCPDIVTQIFITFLLGCTIHVLLRKLVKKWRRLASKKLFLLLSIWIKFYRQKIEMRFCNFQ